MNYIYLNNGSYVIVYFNISLLIVIDGHTHQSLLIIIGIVITY